MIDLSDYVLVSIILLGIATVERKPTVQYRIISDKRFIHHLVGHLKSSSKPVMRIIHLCSYTYKSVIKYIFCNGTSDFCGLNVARIETHISLTTSYAIVIGLLNYY